MTRFRRRLWIGASLLVLVLLGFGGWFYFVAFANLEAALYRAEAFAFRRMMVTQLAEQTRTDPQPPLARGRVPRAFPYQKGVIQILAAAFVVRLCDTQRCLTYLGW